MVEDQIKELNAIVGLKEHLNEQMMYLNNVGESYSPGTAHIGVGFKLRDKTLATAIGVYAQKIIAAQLDVIDVTLAEVAKGEESIAVILEQHRLMISEAL